ncbi:MAG TPA: ribonuclease E/G, partial [Pyrinomonadaceae bacterium]|nr:ribonuclease E/G [Pyrinomonadaceae bacterium]
MSKEMIISVNGREKKIAILDNGKVTEFYIERGEENSGVVGNIYKGRVQRVLPGMQSAFVEIGLERDAFLYVSDFFDEEEEIERIVMEKSKKASPEEIKREADDRIERARLEREKQMEAVQEIAEPLAEIGAEIMIDGATETEEEVQPQSKRRDRRRGKKNRETVEETATEESEETNEIVTETPLAELFVETFSTDLNFEDSGFERIVDDEETGEMFKDAYRQESIVDKVRAIEFDIEATTEAEVGSLIGSVANEANGFERIADEDEEVSAPVAEEAKPAKGRNRSRGGKSKKKAEPAKEEAKVEEVSAPKAAEEVKAEEKPAPKAKGKSSKKSSKAKTAVEEKPEVVEEVKAEEPKPAPKAKSGGSKKSRSKSKKPAAKEVLEDAEASVKESSGNAEMAVRRGGRGGRRRGGRNRRPGGRTEERYENSEMDEAGFEENEIIEAEFEAPEKEVHQEKPRNQQHSNRREPRDNREERNSRDNREHRDNRDNRDDRNSRDNRRSQPTITDLLREGQEILVQIAKEPIARKGARITSHIALPGRFLVYMPTIEHLGVSRKIESSNERGRLRTLIQSIKREENVPSGGFIVRTAGVGISDEDLR